MIKPSEVRELLKKDCDPKLLKVLLMLADELRGAENCITQLATMLDQLIDQMNKLAVATNSMGLVLEKLPEARKLLDSLRGNNEDLGGDDGHGSH